MDPWEVPWRLRAKCAFHLSALPPSSVSQRQTLLLILFLTLITRWIEFQGDRFDGGIASLSQCDSFQISLGEINSSYANVQPGNT